MSFTAFTILPMPVTVRGNPLPAPSQRAFPDLTIIDAVYGGLFRITGTVKRKDWPANTPLMRRVVLLNEANHHLLRGTWSDADTGEYVFDSIRGDLRYVIISYDYEGVFRAVIADNIAAEAIPL
jgi:hypothetical protein